MELPMISSAYQTLPNVLSASSRQAPGDLPTGPRQKFALYKKVKSQKFR